MSEWTRRTALRALALLPAAGVAGCSADRSRVDPPSDPRRGPPVAYTARKVRDTDGAPVFWTDGERPARDTVDGTGDDSGDSQSRPPIDHQSAVVDGASRDVTFATEGEAAAELETFARATDTDSRTLVLFTAPLRECYDVEILRVSRGSGELYASFCQSFRPAGTACGADAYDTVAFGIRVPTMAVDRTDVDMEIRRECGPVRPYPVRPDDETEGGDDA